MSSIYIISDNGKLSKKDETIVFTQSDETKTILFPFKTEQLILIGSVSISGDALRLLTKYKIQVLLLSKNGKFNGKISFGENKNVFLRQKQYAILSDEKTSLEIARSIVSGKIKNQISFMQRIKRKSSSIVSEKILKDNLVSIKNTLINVEKANEIEQLRGYEGIAARNYFAVFGMNINPEWAVFRTRSKNPPLTNVNAVLSFLYTLLMYRVESAIQAQGLDSCCGNLHALNYGKSALVYDLMEEFRSPIADSLCCSLFNLGILKPEDFEDKTLNQEENIDDEVPMENVFQTSIPDTSLEMVKNTENLKAIFLTKEGLKKVIKAFEEKMDNMILYAPTGEKVSYKKIIFEQAEHYKRVIAGEEIIYQSYYFK